MTSAQLLPADRFWILDSSRDLLLFIATPLLIVPVVAAAQLRLSIVEIAVLVGAFGALGHHLPGMLRAYGNRDLFDRYRVRFVLAPIFFISVCSFFAYRDLHGVILVTILWGAWHGLAQVYGFCRIYDAKIGSQSATAAVLDRWVCITWFVGGVLHSPSRIAMILESFYEAGGPVVALSSLDVFRDVWDVGIAGVTLAFLVNLLWQGAHGVGTSLQKLLVMGSSIAFWWYSLVWIEGAILGVAMFEIFHDVQYVAISWVYNRRIVEKGRRVGAFTRFLFRPRGIMLGMYVGLVFLYGSSRIFTDTLEHSDLRTGLLSVLAASTLLHFYFDGFIWKVSERSIRDGLDAAGGTLMPSSLIRSPKHNLLFGSLCLALGLLASTELSGLRVSLDQRQSLVDIVPDDADARIDLAQELDRAGRPEEAAVQYRAAQTLRPDEYRIWVDLGRLYIREQKWDEASAAYSDALELAPQDPLAHHSLGQAYQMQGRGELAEREYRLAIELDPTRAAPYNSLGVLLHRRGDIAAAGDLYRRALEIDPELDGARTNLEILLRRDAQGARDSALEIDSHFAR